MEKEINPLSLHEMYEESLETKIKIHIGNIMVGNILKTEGFLKYYNNFLDDNDFFKIIVYIQEMLLQEVYTVRYSSLDILNIEDYLDKESSIFSSLKSSILNDMLNVVNYLKKEKTTDIYDLDIIEDEEKINLVGKKIDLFIKNHLDILKKIIDQLESKETREYIKKRVEELISKN